MRNQRRWGFTLVEILVVVAIIVILTVVAIPLFMRARVNANEAAAISSLKAIVSASVAYRTANFEYPANLSDLSGTSPPYLDEILASGSKQGYNYTYSGATNDYNCLAEPSTTNVTGIRSFFVDTSGVIRAEENGTADEMSAPLSS